MGAAYTLPLREALNDSFSSGRFADTKIILYSRRNVSGTISKPKALYANSHVLKSVPYFSDLLSESYAESKPKDFSEPINEDDQAENYGYYFDSDLEDEEVMNTEQIRNKAIPLKTSPLNPLRFPVNDGEPVSTHGEWSESPGKGTIIKIHDISFITFQAFLMYLYTGRVNFAPYRSENNRRSRGAEMVSSSEDSIPRPSPKSIYRLAGKYDVPVLKGLALGAIISGLERCDIVEELFSGFSSNYEDVRAIVVNHLLSVLSGANKNSAKGLRSKINEKIDSYARGDLDHAMDTVALLWKLSKAGGRSPPAPRDKASRVMLTPVSREWSYVEVALIKSIRKGIFLDRKYWTRQSTTASALRPVYMSSVIAGKRLQHINGLVKMLRKGECFDTGEDSDCDTTPEQTSGFTLEVQHGWTVPESLPVLTTGSFASWKSLFFYLCTDIIGFAPLKSQGIGARARYVQEKTAADRPSPRSPKVIYSLARALEIEPLRDLAFTDITSKLTAENVVAELFSRFTSQQGDIAKMQYKLLYEKFATAKGVEFIESMLGGNSAHCAEALKLGLREGLFGGVFGGPLPATTLRSEGRK